MVAMSERLWAPWRLQYIQNADVAEGCIFCDKPSEKRDRENLILHRFETCFVILNLFPYVSGHLMVAPFRHLGELNEMTSEEKLEMIEATDACCRALQAVYRPQGFNLGANIGRSAGAGIVGHVHMHIVPRWAGDTNFMSVVGQTRVLPESLEDTYDKLIEALPNVL